MAKEDEKKDPKIKVTDRDPKRLVKEDDSNADDEQKKTRWERRQERKQRYEDSKRKDNTSDSGGSDGKLYKVLDQNLTADELYENYQKTEVYVKKLQADFANFKRRTQEGRAEVFDTARAEMALKLMPVIDNFDRAAEHVPEAIKKDPWYAGIEGIRKQFADLLSDLGIERIKSVGEDFDPHLHEAISMVDKKSGEVGKIVEEFEAGYQLGDKVIRPARVSVSRLAASDAKTEPGNVLHPTEEGVKAQRQAQEQVNKNMEKE